MHKYLLIALLSLLISSASAQITIGTADLAHANDTFRVSTAPLFSTVDLSPGANYTWDYSSLVDTSQTIDTFLSIGSLPSLVSTYFTFIRPCNLATYSANSFLNLLGIPVTGTYDVYNNSSSSYKERGIGIVTTSLAAPVAFTSDDVVYKFPLQFGNTDSSNSGYSINQIPGVFYGTSKKRVNTVDGWGTLTTPYGTFSVLRVQSVILEHDSVKIDSLMINIGFDVPPVTEYKWLGSGKGIPLLQINTSFGIPTSIVYRDSVRRAISVTEITADNFNFVVYPNPSANNISVKYSLLKAAEISFDVMDAENKMILSEKAGMQTEGEHTFSLSQSRGLAAGTYFLRMNVAGKYFTRPLIVTR